RAGTRTVTSTETATTTAGTRTTGTSGIVQVDSCVNSSLPQDQPLPRVVVTHADLPTSQVSRPVTGARRTAATNRAHPSRRHAHHVTIHNPWTRTTAAHTSTTRVPATGSQSAGSIPKPARAAHRAAAARTKA